MVEYPDPHRFMFNRFSGEVHSRQGEFRMTKKKKMKKKKAEERGKKGGEGGRKNNIPLSSVLQYELQGDAGNVAEVT